MAFKPVSIVIDELNHSGYVRGYGARELVELVTGRPAFWVARQKGFGVSESTARDVACAAEVEHRHVIVKVVNPRG